MIIDLVMTYVLICVFAISIINIYVDYDVDCEKKVKSMDINFIIICTVFFMFVWRATFYYSAIVYIREELKNNETVEKEQLHPTIFDILND